MSWLRHQMFYPYLTISATQACKSDDLRHVMSPFSLFLSSFRARNKSWDMWGNAMCNMWCGASSKKREKKAASVGCIWRSLQTGRAFTLRCYVIGLQMLLWRMQTLKWDTATLSCWSLEVQHGTSWLTSEKWGLHWQYVIIISNSVSYIKE